MTKLSDAQTFLDLARFVQAPNQGGASGSPAVAAKQAQVSQTSQAKQSLLPQSSLAKQAIYGSPEEQRVVATGLDQGIAQYSEDEALRDRDELDPLAYAAKYGVQASLDRYKFDTAQRQLQELKDRDRTLGTSAKDFSLDAARMGTEMIGGAAVLGAAAYDSVMAAPARAANAIAGREVIGEPTPLSPFTSRGKDRVTGFISGAQSDLRQERAEQHALEARMRQEENQANYEADLAAAAGEAEGWDRVTKPWLKKQASDFGDTIANYADDPIMAGALVPEGIGSLLPATGAIKAVGAARALGKLVAKGMSEKEAKDFLKTKAGKDLLDGEMMAAAPIVIGVTESGAGVSQTQQEILGMSEEQLMASPAYARMREEGISADEAQMRLARDAGALAGSMALPGALVAGKIAAPFAAKPLSVPRGTGKSAASRVTTASRNVGSEAVEETIQEGNSQLVTNAAMQAAGYDVALDRNVASSAAEGALGGIASAGPMQAPGLAGGLAKDGAIAAAKGAEKAIDRSVERTKAKVNEQSTVGEKAQSEAGDRFAESAGAALTPPAAEGATETTESTEAPKPAELTDNQKTVARAAFLDPAETEDQVANYPDLAAERDASPNKTVKRSSVVREAEKVLKDKSADPQLKLFAALDAVLAYDQLRQVDSDAVNAEFKALPKDDPRRKAHEAMLQDLQTLESSPVLDQAEEVMKGVTAEQVDGFAAEMNKPDKSPEEKAVIAKSIAAIARVNPLLVNPVNYDTAMAQVGSGRMSAAIKNSLARAKAIAETFLAADEQKKQIRIDQDEVIESLKPETRDRLKASPLRFKAKDIIRDQVTFETVKDDIATGGNRKNGLPSLLEHRRRVTDAAAAGRTKDAQLALEELTSFATSQINKIKAFNESVSNGKGKAGAVKFRAYNGEKMFTTAEGVWVAPSNPFSVAQAREAHVDTQTAVALARDLAETHGLTLPEVFDVPELDQRITSARGLNPASTVAATAPAEPVADAAPVEEEAETVEEGPAAVAADETVESTEAEETTDPVAQDQSTEVEEAAPQADAVVPWFNSLKSELVFRTKQGLNMAITAFKPKKNGTTLVAYEDPGQYVLDNLDQFSDEESSAITSLVQTSMPGLIKTMSDRMSQLIKDKKWAPKLLDETGTDKILGFDEALPLNFVVEKQDGTGYEIEPRVAQAMSMAALEWAIQSAGRSVPSLDKERVSMMFGLGRNGHVTADMIDQAQYGMPLQTAVEQIAQGIQDLLGLEAMPDAPVKETQGLFRGLAVNAIETMMSHKDDATTETVSWSKGKKIVKTGVPGSANKGFIQSSLLSYEGVNQRTNKPEPRQMISLRVNPELAKNKAIADLKGIGSPFSQMFVPEHEKQRLVGKPARDVKQTQLGNKLAGISETVGKVINRLQKAPSYINTPMLDLFDTLGDGFVASALGFQKITEEMEKTTNRVDLAKIKSKNRAILRGLEESRRYAEEAAAQGEKTPIFFRWRLSSVGRLQQEGPVTPQGDKIARELISATNSTLDLTNPEHETALWLAVAQSVDISVEKMSHEDAIKEAQDLMKDPEGLRAAVDLAQSWVADSDVDAEQFRSEFKAALDASGQKVTPKLIHAVLTVARAQEAREAGTESQFETALALEADGKTDGPVNAMVHLGTRAVTPEEVERLAKGGLFFTSQPISLNEFIEAEYARNKGKKKKAEDLYHLAAAKFKTLLSDSLKENAPQMLSVLTVLDAFLPDFSLGKPGKDGSYDPEIGRNVVKNPLTVFLYGSGEKGIAAKIAGAAMDTLYGKLTEVARGMADGSLKSWREHPMFKENPGLDVALAAMFSDGPNALQDLDDFLSNPAGAELTRQSFDAMVEKVQAYFAGPMLEAVDDVTGGLATNMQTMQKASQVQTLIAQDIYEQQLAAQNEANGNTSQANLSSADLEESFISTMDMLAIYDTEDQSFHISPAEKTTTETPVSRTFSGRLKTKATYIRPADASVKVSPFVTIGTGDGQMMLNIYSTMLGALDRSLAVFDGVEQSLDSIKETSTAINKAVWDAWMGTNVFQSVADGYGQLTGRMTQARWDSLSENTKKQIGRTLGWSKKDLEESLPTLQDVLVLQDGLDFLARSAADRKAAMGQMATQTDHMAGAKAPHSHEGLTTPGDNPLHYGAIARRLNQLIKKAKTARLKAAKEKAKEKKTAGYAQAPNAALTAAIAKVGQPLDGFPGVTWTTGAALLRILNEKTGLTADQKVLLEKVLAGDGLFKETAYYFGSSEELTAARDYYHGALNKADIELGLSYAGTNVAFISNASPETILHEMLHTRTVRVLEDHFADPSNSPGHVQIAVRNFDQLLNDVWKLQSDSKALATLKAELARHKGNKAAQISELISYTLTNQDLIETTQKMRSYSGLNRIIKAGLIVLQKVLGLSKQDLPDSRIWSQIRFNTEVITSERTYELDADTKTDLMLAQVYGDDSRLDAVEEQFVNRLSAVLDVRQAEINAGPEANNLDADAMKQEQARLIKQGQDAAARATKGSFALNAREQAAFRAVHAAMSAGIRFDASVSKQITTLFDHVLKTLTAEDIMAATEADQATAEKQIAFLSGARGTKTDALGRSDILASFMALAQTSPELRKSLEQMKVNPPADLNWGSVDQVVASIGNLVMSLLTRMSLRKPTRTGTVATELDRLSAALTEVQADRRYMATLAQVSEKMDQANDFVSRGLDRSSKAAVAFLDQQGAKAPTRAVRSGARIASTIAALGSKEASANKGDAITSLLNQMDGWKALRSLMSDFRGATSSNAVLLRLINRVKSQVDQLRQDFREGVPKDLAKAFSRKITRAEWTHLHKGMGMSDVMALGLLEARALMAAPETLAARVAAAEETLKAEAPKFDDHYKAKAKALAIYMVEKRVTSQHLLRNARAIAHLFGELEQRNEVDVSDKTVEAIERLTALYAYELMPQETKDTLKALSKEEPGGMELLTGTLASARQLEKEKALSDDPLQANIALNNAWAGWLPSQTEASTQVIVIDDSEHDTWRMKGYVRIGDYQGDRNEGYKGRRGYYQSKVAGKAAFRQGIAQSVHATYGGVNAITGKTLPGETAGSVMGARAKRLAQDAAGAMTGDMENLAPGDYLLPVFDGQGNVVAYERPMAPEMLEGVQKDTHLGRMLGVWMGRQFEEKAADQFNTELVQTLKEIYERDMAAGVDMTEYVNVADSKDKLVEDAWDTLGFQIKADAEDIFERKGFLPVRKDMVDDAIGYRAASLTDPWNGASQLPQGIQKAFKDLTTVIAGEKAYAMVKRFENGVQDAVSYAKTTIIVRSVIVGTSNIASNALHLTAKGVSPLKMGKVGRQKMLEINEFVRNREKIQSLQLQYAAKVQDPKASRVIEGRIKALEDANARMSIWPLIQAGEFSTISEDLTEADVAIREGRWGDYIEKSVEKLPGWTKTAVKNIAVTKDTELFKGLNRMVQYGDFVAKAILYDHLLEKGMGERQALDEIMEEFVQYNRLPGRGRDALESMGLLWFMNYALRIQKITVKLVRERPLSALMMMGQVGPMSGVDSVMSGSLAGKVADGSIWFSTGTQMGFNAPFLNPWWNLSH